jgi:hypothetical protein
MKKASASKVAWLMLLATLAVGLAGCTHTIRFQAVDAATKKPLSGVNTEWKQMRYGMFIRTKAEMPVNLPPTGQDGMIVASGLHSCYWRNWHDYFTFTCPGFSNVYVIYAGSTLSSGERKRDFQFSGPWSDGFWIEGNVTSIVASNGCFLIPMRR